MRSVLSDVKRRKLYDAGFYNPLQEDEEEVEVITDKLCNNIGVTTNTGRKSTNFEGSSLNSLKGFDDFVKEMVSLMASVRKEVILILMSSSSSNFIIDWQLDLSHSNPSKFRCSVSQKIKAFVEVQVFSGTTYVSECVLC